MSCGLSSIQLSEYWPIGDRGFAPFQGGTNVFSVSDTLDMIRGKHDVRVGIGIRANQMNVRSNNFQDGAFFMLGGSGSYTGDDAADLLLGQASNGITPRPDVQRGHHRPPLEDVPPVRPG